MHYSHFSFTIQNRPLTPVKAVHAVVELQRLISVHKALVKGPFEGYITFVQNVYQCG